MTSSPRSGTPVSGARAIGLFLVVGCSVGALLYSALVGTPLEESPVERLWPLSWVGFPTTGALLLIKRPGNAIGRLLLLIGVSIAVGLVGTAPALAGEQGAVVAWLGSWLSIPGFALVPFLVLLFPSGTLPSPRWRWPIRIAIDALAFEMVYYALRPGAIEATPFENPFGWGALTPLRSMQVEFWAALLLVAFFVAATVNAGLRFRRGSSLERKQLKWFVLPIGIFPVAFVGGNLLEDAIYTLGQGLQVFAFVLTLNGIAIGIALAITRHGLYEIDRIVSRTLSYGLLTAVLVGVYVGSVLVLSGVVRSLGGDAESPLVVAGSTLAVATLFGPARRRIQGTIDRRFNRARYDAARVVEELGRRLRATSDLQGVARYLQHAAELAVQPTSASISLARRS